MMGFKMVRRPRPRMGKPFPEDLYEEINKADRKAVLFLMLFVLSLICSVCLYVGCCLKDCDTPQLVDNVEETHLNVFQKDCAIKSFELAKKMRAEGYNVSIAKGWGKHAWVICHNCSYQEKWFSPDGKLIYDKQNYRRD